MVITGRKAGRMPHHPFVISRAFSNLLGRVTRASCAGSMMSLDRKNYLSGRHRDLTFRYLSCPFYHRDLDASPRHSCRGLVSVPGGRGHDVNGNSNLDGEFDVMRAIRNNPHLSYQVDEITGCWNWIRYTGSDGYGRLRIGGGKRIPAHRYFYELENGPIAAELQVDHLCHNRACVNPGHLEPVTQAENIRRGDNTKISRRELKAIRLWAQIPGVTQKSISEAYGISQQQVSNIICGRKWKGE